VTTQGTIAEVLAGRAVVIDAIDRAKFDKLAAERAEYRAKWYSSECSNETP
jgi:hypothetical protein